MSNPDDLSNPDVFFVQLSQPDALVVYCQPIIALDTGRMSGLEALVRWRHPLRGLLLPAAFLPRAAEHYLIAYIDRQVLQQACRQAMAWQRQFHLPVPVSVNLSTALLDDPDLPLTVRTALSEAGMEPGALTLEVVEETLLNATDTQIRNLKHLRALGVRLCLDDFGAGYAALRLLSQLPLTAFKIDRSLISHLDVDPHTALVVQAMSVLGRTLGLDVIAEGVETAAQLERLRGAGCSHGQGFLFAPPLDSEQAERRLRDETRRAGAASAATPASDQEAAPPLALTPATADTPVANPTQAAPLTAAFFPASPVTPPVSRPVDSLTGCWNRETLPAYFEEVRAAAQRLKQSFALAMLDIDHFKSVNDAYGHARGDATIVEFARRLMDTVRASDRIFRYGGDEFVAILPAVDRGKAAAFGARLLEQISAAPFAGDPLLSLTTSIGIAVFPADGASYDELFETADRRNNQAKRAGRACVVVEDAAISGTVTLEGPSRLIERDQAIYELHNFIDALDIQRRGILRLVGMPGAGITRMLNEAAQALARRGYGVLRLQGTPALRRRVQGALAEALMEMGEPALLDGTPVQWAATLAERLVERRQRGLVMILDDLPDIDLDSLNAVRELFESSALACVALVYASPGVATHGILPEEAPLNREIAIAPLSVEGLRAWLRHSFNREAPDALLAWLHAQTGGMPGLIYRALAYLVARGLLQPFSAEALYGSSLLSASLHGRLEQARQLPERLLPLLSGGFVGRAAELRFIRQLLMTQQLVTLVGPGGVGKSRLAAQVAAELYTHFADGVRWIAVTPISSGEFLIYAVADALGLTLTGALPPLEQVCAHLRRRQMLLVLDGFEYLRGATPLLHAIIDDAPGVRMLITSRDRLPIAEVVTVDIRGLPYPEQEDAAVIAHSSAVQFFVRAARQSSLDFDLTADSLEAIVRICRLVEGMPLGIQMAAGWVRTLSCAAIADSIARDLAQLPGSVQPSGQLDSLIATIDYFWYMLAAVEQQTLQRIAVFCDGFTHAAAQQVTGASLFFLDALVAKGYLHLTRAQRYETHELLRQYAAARLREDTAAYQSAHTSHSSYYLELIRQHDLLSAGSRHALHTISADLKNVRAAWAWALAQGMVGAIAQSIPGLLTFYDLSAGSHEAATVFEQTAATLQQSLAEHPDDPALVQRTIGYLRAAQSRFLVRLSLYGEAIDAARAALDLAVLVDDTLLESLGNYFWGEALSWQGAAAEARERYQQALELARRAAAPAIQSDVLRKMARILSGYSQHTEARALMEQALELAHRIGDRTREGRALNDLGIITESLGDGVMAHDFYEQCLRLTREIGDRPGEGSALLNLGALALDQRRFDEAECCFELALPIFLESGDRHNEAIVLENSGDSARQQGDFNDAQHYYERALQIYSTTGERRGVNRILHNLGLLAALRGDNQRADALVTEALQIARETDNNRLWAAGLALRGQILIVWQRYAEASQAYEQALALYEAQGQPHLATEARAGLVRVALAQNDWAAAAQHAALIAAYLETGTLNWVTDPVEVMLTCVRGLQRSQPERARALLEKAHQQLEQYAASITREDRRSLFLEQAPANRELREEVRRARAHDSS